MPPTINGFLGQKSILRELVLAANVQTEWATPVATGALVEAIRFDAGAFVKVARGKESTYGQAGALNSFANQNWTTSQKTSLDISGFLTDWIAGWLFGLAMGKEVVVGGAAPYSHTFNFLDTGTIAQCSTLYAKDTNDLAYLLPDFGVSQLTVTSTSTGALKYKASLLGTGRIVQGIVAGMPTPVTRQQLYGSDMQVAIGPAAGSATSFYPRVRSLELTIDTGMVQEFASGGGLYAGYLSTAMPKVKLKMSLAANGTDDIFGWKQNDTLLQCIITTTSGPAQINITLPNFTLDENTMLSDQNGLACWSIDLAEMDILQIGSTPLITVNIVNTVASYLTAA